MKRSGKHQMEARKALWKEIADKSDIVKNPSGIFPQSFLGSKFPGASFQAARNPRRRKSVCIFRP